MCGRLVITEPDLTALVEPFHVQQHDVAEWQPRYNLAPTQPAPLITNEAERRVTLARFGLIPFWAKDAKVSHKLINARVEGVARSNAFKRSLSLRRGIIPVIGWLEWQKTEHGRMPLFIHDAQDTPLALAALWERWRDPDGQVVQSFAVLTRPALGSLEAVHTRMPLTLHGDALDAWLDPEPRTPEQLADVLHAEPDIAHLVTRPVSKLANSPNNDVPECLADPETPPASRQLALFDTIADAKPMRRTR
ncbi:MAG: SOS response-associated peptidase [Polyangiales bacterium]